jgi:UDP-N-acetyl-D-glucosamine dehydrogenase
MDNPNRAEDKKPVDETRLATQVELWSYESYADDEPDESHQTLASSLLPKMVIETVMVALNDEAKAVRNSRILVLGVADKRNSGDVQDSPALDVIERLLRLGAQVSYHDPYVARLDLPGDQALESVELSDALLGSLDCLVIVTDHSAFEWQWIANQTRLLVDCRNALVGVTGRARVVSF